MFATIHSAKFVDGLLGYVANVFVQSTALLLVVWLVQVLLRHRTPGFRRWLWLVPLMLCPFLPLISGAVRDLGLSSMELAWLPDRSPVAHWMAGAEIPVEDLEARAADSEPHPEVARLITYGGESVNSYMPPRAPEDFPGAKVVPVTWVEEQPALGGLELAIAGGYVLGAIALLIGLVFGIGRLLSWMRRCEPVTDSHALDTFREAADETGCREPFFLVEGVPTNSPLTMGYLHPKILIPNGFGEGFDRDELRDIAKHELTHVRHRDPLSFVALAAVRAVLFFNPLVWIAIRRVKLLAEQSADWSVAVVRHRVMPYTKLLVKMAEHAPIERSPAEAAAGFLFGKSVLLKRSEALLSRKGGYGGIGVLRGTIAGLVVAGGLAGAVVLNVVPAKAFDETEAHRPIPSIARVILGSVWTPDSETERWYLRLFMADATVLECEFDSSESSPTYGTWFLGSRFPGDPEAERLEPQSSREQDFLLALEKWYAERLPDHPRTESTGSPWAELEAADKAGWWIASVLRESQLRDSKR